MAWYEYPNSTDTEGIFQLFGYINRTADGLFFPVMLLVIWFITFLSSLIINKDGGNEASAKSFTFASFLVAIMSIMFAIMGFLNAKFMYLSFVLVALGALWLKSAKGD